jgi:hypothetical protein
MAVMFNFAFVLVRMKTLFSIGKYSTRRGGRKERIGVSAQGRRGE